MGSRAEDLAARFARAQAGVVAAIEERPADHWSAVCPAEGWSVGTTARHLARSYRRVMAVVTAVAAGRTVPPVNWQMIDDDNARHASDHPAPDRAETMAMLRHNGAEVTAAIRALPDEDLDRTIAWGLANDRPTSAAQLVEWHLIDHAAQHLAGIRAAVPTSQRSVSPPPD